MVATFLGLARRGEVGERGKISSIAVIGQVVLVDVGHVRRRHIKLIARLVCSNLLTKQRAKVPPYWSGRSLWLRGVASEKMARLLEQERELQTQIDTYKAQVSIVMSVVTTTASRALLLPDS